MLALRQVMRSLQARADRELDREERRAARDERRAATAATLRAREHLGETARLDEELVGLVVTLHPAGGGHGYSRDVLRRTALALACRFGTSPGASVPVTLPLVRECLRFGPAIWWKREGSAEHVRFWVPPARVPSELASARRLLAAGDACAAYEEAANAAARLRADICADPALVGRDRALSEVLFSVDALLRFAVALSGRVRPGIRRSAWTHLVLELTTAMSAISVIDG